MLTVKLSPLAQAGVVPFIGSVASILGGALDRRRKRCALEILAQMTKDVDVTAVDVEDAGTDILENNVIFSKSIAIVDVPNAEEHDDESRGGISGGVDESSLGADRGSVGSVGGSNMRGSSSTPANGSGGDGGDDADKLTRAIWARCRLVEQPDMSFALGAQVEAPPEPAFARRSKTRAPAITAVRQTKEEAEREAEREAEKKRLSEILVRGEPSSFYAVFEVLRIVDELINPQLVNERKVFTIERRYGVRGVEDINFTSQLCRVMEMQLKCIAGRKWRHYARQIALERLLRLCRQWREPHVTLEVLFASAIAEAEVLLPGCAMYFGVVQPRGTHIQYVAASEESITLGKRLRRGRGLSFRCVDERTTELVRSAESDDAKQLNYFCPVANAGWPWITVPLRHGDSLVRGVFTVDGFDLVPKGREDEEHPEKGVPEFLERIGALIGSAVDLKNKHESIEELVTLHKSGQTLTIDAVYVRIVCVALCQ